MADKLTIEARSRNMSKIASKNTKPEIVVRKLLTSMGYRYRLHRKDLPGRPDVAFISRRKAIFIHGCFWHQHSQCIDGRVPKSRLAYWLPKLQRNVERDTQNIATLRDFGWQTLVLWECELSNNEKLSQVLHSFLEDVE